MAERRAPSRRRGNRATSGGAGEHAAGSGWRTALIELDTAGVKPVQYTVVDGLAMFEGDIVLGTVEEVEQRTELHRQMMTGAIAAGVVVTGANRRWPNCQVPFDIDPNLPDQARVTGAIAHWEANTRYRFVARTAANAAQFPDWVTFRPAGGCSSSVGRQGGQQFVNLGTDCSRGNTIHEIGHTIGLWHEQSREDRDAFVTIHFDRIQAGMEHNFDQHIADGDDVGPYDYGSIMHYPRTAFSFDNRSETITPVDPNAQIGQRTALSAGDIAAANSLCPIAKLPIVDRTTIKEVAKDVVRDTFKEGTKDVIADTRKEVVLDTIKEVTADPTIKEVAKDPIRDIRAIFRRPIGPIDPGPIRGIGGQLGGLFGGDPFGGQVPFAVATGHQAPGAGAGAAEAAAAAGGAEDVGVDFFALQAQLAQIMALLNDLDAQRAFLQQQVELLTAQLAALAQQLGAGGFGGGV
jgi:astacin (peptidase family M12A)